MEQIAGRLKKPRMAQYAPALADNDIDFSVLRHLTDQHLKDLRVPRGHRLEMLQSDPVILAKLLLPQRHPGGNMTLRQPPI
jgi:hypothetical protein